MAAVDIALGPGTVSWASEILSSSGTPSVVGSPMSGAPFPSIFLDGPADDLRQIAVTDAPAKSIDDASLALAILRASVPAAQDWFTSGFSQSPDYEMKAFGRLTVGWGRDVDYMHGYHLSWLTVDTGPVLPVRTPMPTRAPTPAPTEAPDPISLLPTAIRGVTMERRSYLVSELPDDQACLPICKREVEAFAGELKIDPASISVAIARAHGDPTFRFAIAIVRVPVSASGILIGRWTNGLKRTVWPNLVIDSQDYPGKSVDVLRHAMPPNPATRSTVWYVRWSGNLLYIASDTAAGGFSSPPSETLIDDIFGPLP